ncbi:hypothetical protein NKR19_g7501 [Coniochaeta hoffmannii]|uniref:Uncharacterized protein n=1 Tax=Coniochaeta hoffmannii TaxID=91930 RepID=A0AA38VG94_9PEZI|nr:hypothetical protein NKR19_g7501 [Coniochaeta hoffmannii]
MPSNNVPPADDLSILHKYLTLTHRYFTNLTRRLSLSLPTVAADADTRSLISRTRDTLSSASRACGPQHSAAHHRHAPLPDLEAACRALAERGGAVREAWEALLQRTDKSRPNAVVLAVCFATEATEGFAGEVEGVAGMVTVRQGRDEGMGRKEVDDAVRAARERAQDLGPLARVHPARRGKLRREMDRARRHREVRRETRRGRRKICIDL